MNFITSSVSSAERWIKMKQKFKTIISIVVALSICLTMPNYKIYAKETNSAAEQNSVQNDLVEIKEDTEEKESTEESSIDVTKPADFVFAIDSTGSMSGYIKSVKSNLLSFMEYINEKDIDIKFSIVDFKDITKDGNDSTTVHQFENASRWSSDIEKVGDALGNIRTGGGGDNPETPTDAFGKIIEFEDWREGSQKYIFLLTDADFKDSDDGNLFHAIKSMDECINIFRQNNVHVSVVGQPKYKERYNSLYTLTGGKYLDINQDDYYKVMIEIANWVFDGVIDTDGDGIPDEWETNGVDFDHDGEIDLHLEKMGADPNKKDIFIEVDWMYRPKKEWNLRGTMITSEEEKNLYPSPEAMKMVWQQFDNHDINLHIDAGADSTDYVTGKKWGELSGGNSIPYSNNFELGDNYEKWNETALENFDKRRWSVFRYCLFVNKYNNEKSSGIAENIPGQCFIVADVDNWISSTATATAGTFMHELGHTLGLKHGGSDHTQYKPNDLSIMNYLFQTTGLCGTSEVNYSEYELPEIHESSVDENKGVDPEGVTIGSGLGTKWYRDERICEKTNIAGQGIDFNENGKMDESISVNLNRLDDDGKLLKSINEWDNLIFKGGLIGGYGENISEETALITCKAEEDALTELDYDTAKDFGLLGNLGSCSIDSINPEHIYNNVGNQQLYITISNLSVKETSPILKVSSDILESEFEKEVEVPGAQGEIKSVTINVPLKKSLSVGLHKVQCNLTCDSGTIESRTVDVNVSEAPIIKLLVGDKEEILPSDIVNNYNWSSSDECVSIGGNGDIIVNKVGKAIITGTKHDKNQIVYIVEAYDDKNSVGGGITDSVIIPPSNIEPSANTAKFIIKAPSKKIAKGKKVKLTAMAGEKILSNQNVIWQSGNKKYATVSADGVVTMKKAGAGKTVTITAVSKYNSSVKAMVKIRIMKNAVTKVKVKNPPKTLKAGAGVTLKAFVATNGKSANKTLKWTSSNTRYATVNTKGKVVAKKAGEGKTVTITARSTDGTNKEVKVKIKIK